ncbi:type IV toxin-antitoxin system AbiEi family antitoxin domain-containing protein [Gordonia sp. NPDC003424]
MDEPVLRRADAIANGLSDRQLARDVRQGTRVRIWHGVYLPTADRESSDTHQARADRYRSIVTEVAKQGTDARVVSHVSAAAVHDVPLLWPDIGLVHFTSQTTDRRIKRGIVHQARLRDESVALHEGIRVTSVARTVCNVARVGDQRQAVCALDSGLHLGASMDDIVAEADVLKRHRGIAVLRSALPLVDGHSESVSESLSRLVLGECPAVPRPELQVVVWIDMDGAEEARCDFGWRDAKGRLRVVGEFDGRFKYHRTSPFGERLPEEVIYREKLREDALRNEGLVVVRWTWSDLQRPDRLYKRVVAALRTAGLAG